MTKPLAGYNQQVWLELLALRALELEGRLKPNARRTILRLGLFVRGRQALLAQGHSPTNPQRGRKSEIGPSLTIGHSGQPALPSLE
jgi:hypothetical protein